MPANHLHHPSKSIESITRSSNYTSKVDHLFDLSRDYGMPPSLVKKSTNALPSEILGTQNRSTLRKNTENIADYEVEL